MKTNSIAIVGSGIAGLTCAYHLHRRHQVTVYEAADYLGGHTHTVTVDNDGERERIDTGFIVFNDRTYPNFLRLMGELQVAFQPTEMSFSVRNDALCLEYNGGNLNGLFAQRTNLLRPWFLRMLADIVRFNRDVQLAAEREGDVGLGAFLDRAKYSATFRDNYLLPMVSAIWSMGLDDCRHFPLRFFVRFFDNHGLLDLVDRPQWHTIVGGSGSYIEPLTQGFADSIRLSTPVVAIRRREQGVEVTTGDGSRLFDHVIVACHADQALRLLSDPTPEERAVLGAFHFADNEVVLHTDTSLLPVNRRAWASWNYRVTNAAAQATTLTYNMNILQRLAARHTYLVSLNQEVDGRRVLGRFRYSHPVYSLAAVDAQERWPAISGTDRIHYCGAYWRNGFHEDGVVSGLRVVAALEGEQ